MNFFWIRVVFSVSAIYDGALGVAFLLFGSVMFRTFGVTPPNHMGYVQFPAILLVVFAVMFLQIARDPAGHRNLMLYGAALKAAYSGVVFWYQVKEGIPSFWIPWAWADLVFLLLFLLAWKRTRPE
jgi:hypothetical protein